MNAGLTQRIAAGGLIIKDGKILLAKYRGKDGDFFLAPGGGVMTGESLRKAAEREIYEETGVEVWAHIPVLIEQLLTNQYYMVKIWYLCEFIKGTAGETSQGKKDGIIGVDWYSYEQIAAEKVYPEIVKMYKIDELQRIKSGAIDPGIIQVYF